MENTTQMAIRRCGSAITEPLVTINVVFRVGASGLLLAITLSSAWGVGSRIAWIEAALKSDPRIVVELGKHRVGNPDVNALSRPEKCGGITPTMVSAVRPTRITLPRCEIRFKLVAPEFVADDGDGPGAETEHSFARKICRTRVVQPIDRK